MRAVTAYFAGVGTVAVAIAAGLGGGLMLGDIMSPQQPKHQSSEVTRLEQRASPPPIPATNGATRPVPYMATDQVANTVAEEPRPQAQPQPARPQAVQSPQAQPQVQQASTRPAEPKPQGEQGTSGQATAAPPKAGNEQRAALEDAFATTRDADLRRDERRAEDKRKYERRKWSERRKWQQRDDDDLREVEASVRADTERRSFGRNEGFFGRDERRFDRGEQRPMFGGGPGFGRSFSLFDD